MLSYPTSFKSSRLGSCSKQNQHPNLPCIGSSKSSRLPPHPPQPLLSHRSQEQLSGAVSWGCSVPCAAQECITDSDVPNVESFQAMARTISNKCEASTGEIIDFCTTHCLYNREDILQYAQGGASAGAGNPRRWLASQLGQLMVRQLCRRVGNGQELGRNEQAILGMLFVDVGQQQLTAADIQQQYALFVQECALQHSQITKIENMCKTVWEAKVRKRLDDHHQRLQLSQGVRMREEQGRISYQSLLRTLGHLLSRAQCELFFKYLHALETGTVMAILDMGKTISSRLLLSRVLNFDGGRPEQTHPETQRNPYFIMEQHHRAIQALKQKQQSNQSQLQSKDRQIEGLQCMIDMIQIEKQNQRLIYQEKLQVQLQANRLRYEGKIEELEQKYRNEVKLTEWYRRELEAVVEAVGRENAMASMLGQARGTR